MHHITIHQHPILFFYLRYNAQKNKASQQPHKSNTKPGFPGIQFTLIHQIVPKPMATRHPLVNHVRNVG